MVRFDSLRHSAFALSILPFFGTGFAQAADVFIVHGVPGDDLGLPTELTVDIAANGSCLLPGASFRNIAGPLDIDPGSYDISISLAESANPCSGAIAMTAEVDIAIGPVSIVIAHLDQNGGPTITKFTSKTVPVAADETRLTIYHTAAMPPIDLQVIADNNDRAAAFQGLINGEQTFPVDLPIVASYRTLVSFASGFPGRFNDPIVDIAETPSGGSASAVFAVGSLDNNTFSAILVPVIP